MVGSKSSKDYSSRKARLALSSPLEALSQVEVSVGLDSSASQHKVSARLLTAKDQVVSSTLVLSTPISWTHVDMDLKVQTPYKGYKSMGITLSHNLDDALNTKVRRTQYTYFFPILVLFTYQFSSHIKQATNL